MWQNDFVWQLVCLFQDCIFSVASPFERPPTFCFASFYSQDAKENVENIPNKIPDILWDGLRTESFLLFLWNQSCYFFYIFHCFFFFTFCWGISCLPQGHLECKGISKGIRKCICCVKVKVCLDIPRCPAGMLLTLPVSVWNGLKCLWDDANTRVYFLTLLGLVPALIV